MPGIVSSVKPSLHDLRSYFKKNQKTKEYSAHSSKVHSVDWNADGSKLASGSFDKTICVFSLGSDRLCKESSYRGHSDSVDQLSWHPTDPNILATASGDRTVRIWDARVSKSVSTIPTKGENINIAWCPDGSSLAVGNKEDLLTFIDAKAMKVVREEQFRFEVNEITWNKNCDLFFITNGQGNVHIFNYPEMTLVQVLHAHPGNCICIEFDPSGKYFAVGSADTLVSLWEVKNMACIRMFTRLEWPVRTISFSHDGALLAAASEDRLIDIAHVDTGEKVMEVPVSAPTFTIAWHPKYYLLAYACDDKDKYERERDSGTLKIWGFPSVTDSNAE